MLKEYTQSSHDYVHEWNLIWISMANFARSTINDTFYYFIDKIEARPSRIDGPNEGRKLSREGDTSLKMLKN